MAYKISIWIVLFLLFFNGGAVMLDSMGVDDYLGIDPDTGDTSELETAQNQTQFDSGTGQGQTLLGTYNRVTGVLNTIVNAVGPGAEMVKSAGMPPGVVNFVYTGLVIIPVIDLAIFLRRG